MKTSIVCIAMLLLFQDTAICQTNDPADQPEVLLAKVKILEKNNLEKDAKIAALQTEVAKLKKENESLKSTIVQNGIQLPQMEDSSENGFAKSKQTPSIKGQQKNLDAVIREILKHRDATLKPNDTNVQMRLHEEELTEWLKENYTGLEVVCEGTINDINIGYEKDGKTQHIVAVCFFSGVLRPIITDIPVSQAASVTRGAKAKLRMKIMGISTDNVTADFESGNSANTNAGQHIQSFTVHAVPEPASGVFAITLGVEGPVFVVMHK
jgi:hypothetical protein